MIVHLYAAASVVCTLGGVPVVGPVVGSACNAITGGAGTAASGVAGTVLGTGIGAVFDAAGQWVASGAGWLLYEVGMFMSSSTSVGLGTEWFAVHESVMAALAAAVVLPMAFVGAIQAIYRQDAAVLVRSFLVNLPLAMLLTGVAVELVRLSLSVTDVLTEKVLAVGGVDTRHMLSAVTDFLGSGGLASTGAPAFVVFVVALIVALSSLVLWLELIVRSAAVSAAALFLPLTLAALVWPAVSHWWRRLAETIAALVLSKFVVAAVLSLAVGAIAGGLGTEGGSGGGFSAVVTGIAMLLIATLCPFTLLKLVPAVEAGAIAHLESVRHRLSGAARTPIRARNYAMELVATGASSGSGGSLTARTLAASGGGGSPGASTGARAMTGVGSQMGAASGPLAGRGAGEGDSYSTGSGVALNEGRGLGPAWENAGEPAELSAHGRGRVPPATRGPDSSRTVASSSAGPAPGEL